VPREPGEHRAAWDIFDSLQRRLSLPNMTDLTAPSNASDAAAALNGTFPADDAAGQTVAAMVESEKISAGNIILQTACPPP
jgi:hypothetical protein